MDLLQVINQVGFPIAVATWLLIKQSGDSKKLTEAIEALKTAIEVLTHNCNKCQTKEAAKDGN